MSAKVRPFYVVEVATKSLTDAAGAVHPLWQFSKTFTRRVNADRLTKRYHREGHFARVVLSQQVDVRQENTAALYRHMAIREQRADGRWQTRCSCGWTSAPAEAYAALGFVCGAEEVTRG